MREYDRGVTDGMTDYEKEEQVYLWMIRAIEPSLAMEQRLLGLVRMDLRRLVSAVLARTEAVRST